MVKKKYVLAITAILLCLIFALTGCKTIYQAGNFSYGWLFSPSAPQIGLKADTNIFSKDNVTFDFYYGLYDLNSGTNPREQNKVYNDKKITFVIYACRTDAFHKRIPSEIYDYTKLDGWYYITHINEEDAFTEEYCFSNNSKNGMVYNHNETIKIPKNVFLSQGKKFFVVLVTLVQNDDGTYSMINDRYIQLGYKFLSKHEVKIDFSPEQS